MIRLVFILCPLFLFSVLENIASAPPARKLPPNATWLFSGDNLNLWKLIAPNSAETSIFGGPGYVQPEWNVTARTVDAREKSDIITRHEFGNYELHLDFFQPVKSSDDTETGVLLSGRYEVSLGCQSSLPAKKSIGAVRGLAVAVADIPRTTGVWRSLDLTLTHIAKGDPIVSVWIDGVLAQSNTVVKMPTKGGFEDVVSVNRSEDKQSYRTGVARHEIGLPAAEKLAMGNDDFSIHARFKTRESLAGTLAARAPKTGNWAPKAKALFIRGGRVHYDIGWLGVMSGKTPVNDGKWHNVVLTKRKNSIEIYVDGKQDAAKKDFAASDIAEHVFKIGAASANFAFDFRGLISEVKYFARGLKKKDAELLSSGNALSGVSASFEWKADNLPEDVSRPLLEFGSIPGVNGPIRLRGAGSGIRFANIWIRPLDTIDHSAVLTGLVKNNFENGRRIYEGLCVNCHGADGVTPSLALSRAFGKGDLKFGTDSYSLYRTLTHGNGNMAAQTWMTEAERYDVIHYIRERFMKPMNPKYLPVTKAYLASLPRKIAVDLNAGRSKMVRDFGPALASQFEHRAESALTIALGGNRTLAYDLHTMDLLAVWDGGFLNLDETHHLKLRGEGVPRPDGKVIAGVSQWFWGHEGILDYPKENLLPRGPIPSKWMDYRGHYLHGNRVVMSYSIDGREVLESPAGVNGSSAVVHQLDIGPGSNSLTLCLGQSRLYEDNVGGISPLNAAVHQLNSKSGMVADNVLVAGESIDGKPGEFVAAAVIGDVTGMTWTVDARHRLVLNIPPGKQPTRVRVFRVAGRGEPMLQSFTGLVRHRMAQPASASLGRMTRGGPVRWNEILETRGELGSEAEAYTLDTLNLPASNPWNSWFRMAALDFFNDGRMVLTTHGGDVWIVSGIDRDMEKLQWKRFAAGLYEPFGVRVIDETIYVTCKDRLVRLHDFNDDGEADFYENFSADTDVSFFFHAFNFDLQTDKAGNFYYAKAGQYTDHALPGAIIKVSPDGKSREVYCTGFRTPNGLGMMPDGRPTVSDNQGNWMPASKISLANKGGFYGYVQTHASGKNWAPDGGRIDPKKVVPPQSFDQPIIWMPQDIDNSSGGQLWVDDSRWGPLSGRLLHTSFGKGWMFYLMVQDLGDVAQAAIVKLPLDFSTGIHRARVNPRDGQVYAVGLNGWNGGGRPGLGEGGVQRVRYTGRDAKLLTGARVRPDGIQLEFNFLLDKESARDPASYEIEQWNYKWSHNYGSAQWSVKNPAEQGRDKVGVKRVIPSANGRDVALVIPGIQPVNQMLLKIRVKTRKGETFSEEVYLTINKVPTN